MKNKTVSGALRVGSILLIPLLLFGQVASVKSNPDSSGAQPEPAASFVDKPVASFAELLHFVEILPNRRLLDKLRKGGIAFTLNSEDRKLLESRRRSDPKRFSKILLAEIDAAEKRWITSPPPTPPPPPPVEAPKKYGQLSVTCQPVDCQVSIDGSAARATQAGTLAEPSLLEGEHLVRVKAAGYRPLSPEERVTITPGGTQRVAFHFEPTPELKQEIGAKLLQKMFESLGGEAGLKAVESVHATGTADIVGKDGNPVTWTIATWYRWSSNSFRFRVGRGNKTSDYLRAPNAAAPRWQRPTPESSPLEDHLRRLHEYQLCPLITLLRGPQFKPTAEPGALTSVSGRVLRLEGIPDSYVVKLDQDARPVEILLESPGLMNGLQILLNEYQNLEQAWYPRRVQILSPGTPRQGINIHYETVAVGPTAVSDRDVTTPKSGLVRKSQGN